MRRSHVTDRPFTAVVCHGESCGRSRGDFVVDGLRECIRQCRHGVLVSAGCLLGPLACHARAGAVAQAGPLVLVQRCSTDREPVGAPLWVGPIVTEADVLAVRRWLVGGELTVTDLPAHLRFRATLARHGAAN